MELHNGIVTLKQWHIRYYSAHRSGHPYKCRSTSLLICDVNALIEAHIQ
jgi:hypothetical protein